MKKFSALLLASLILVIPLLAEHLAENLYAHRVVQAAGARAWDAVYPCARIEGVDLEEDGVNSAPAGNPGQAGYLVGVEKWFAGDCAGALQAWREVAAAGGDDHYWAGARLALGELAQGRRAQAVAIFRALEFGPQLASLADAARRAGQTQNALTFYRLALQVDPQPAALLAALDAVRAGGGEAAPVLDEALQDLTPEQAVYWLAQAELSAGQQDWQAARENLEQALRLSGGNDVLYLRLGEIEMEAGAYDRAVAAFERAIQANPFDSYEPYLRAAQAELAAGDSEGADGWFAQAMRRFPNDPWPFLHAADAASQLDRLAQAEQYYLAALSLAPDNVYGLIHLASVKRRQGELDAAISYAEQAYFAAASCHAAALLRDWYPQAGRSGEYQQVDAWYSQACK